MQQGRYVVHYTSKHTEGRCTHVSTMCVCLETFCYTLSIITVGRASPSRGRVSTPPDLKECMVNAVRSPALRACTLSTFVTSGADLGIFPLMGAPVFGCREILGKRYPCVMFQPGAVPTAMYCSTALMGHMVIRLVSYSTVMR